MLGSVATNIKNVLKDYRKQKRDQKVHTGNGEAPIV